MPEDPKKGRVPDPINVTNWALGKIFKGGAWVAKAGYNKYKEGEKERFEKQAVDDIHGVMYAGGTMPVPGTPLPPYRTTGLSAAELKTFTDACNGLTERGIKLPAHVTGFASKFYIKLKP